MKEIQKQSETTLKTTPSPTPVLQSKSLFKNIFLIILGLIIVVGSVYAGIQIGKNQTTKEQPIGISKETSLPKDKDIPTANNSTEWKTAKFGGLFSYEYPIGWSVAELWRDNISENGIIIAIDPNPINTAPRGGPLATFEITILNGNRNPDEILAQRMADFNGTNYSDITKETISADIGNIYHYKGRLSGEMYNNEPIERYFFTFNQNPNDLINQQVVIATLSFEDDPQLSAMLKHIVLSFKKITPIN